MISSTCMCVCRFSATASIRQEVTPGELLLRDWVDQCGNGHTLYVLRNALCRVERYDCAEYMEKEVFSEYSRKIVN